MSVVTQNTSAVNTGGSSGSGNLYDVLELILDRGLVIDAFVRVSLVGIEILKIDIRVVVASVDTYLRFAEACNRLDLESGRKQPSKITDLIGEATESGAKGKSKGALTGVAEAIGDTFGKSDESDSDDADSDEEKPRRKTSTTARRTSRRREE